MIYPESKMSVSDNSGGVLAQCVRILNNSRRKGATLGGYIVISLKKAKPKKPVVKGEVHRALIIRLKKNIQRFSGNSIKSDDNALILVNEKNIPISNRIFGAVCQEANKGTYSKMMTLGKKLI